MIKTVLFDVDGVIYDNSKEIIDFFKKTAELFGLNVPSDVELFNHFGESWDEILDVIWPGIDKEKFNHKFLEIVKNKNHVPKLNDNVKSTLENLKEKYRIAAVSGGTKESIRIRFKNDDIFHLFDFIIAAEDTKKHKPFPDPLLKACERMNIAPKDTVYIGDAINDYRAAKAAGTHFIGFIWNEIEHKTFDVVKLENSVENFKDIPGKINKLS